MLKKSVILILCLIFIKLGCNAIFVPTDIPNTKLLVSEILGPEGGSVTYQNTSSLYNGVSIIAKKRALQCETTFSIYYFESFPYKPKNLTLRSVAYEFRYNASVHRRIKISIPYDETYNSSQGLALWKLDLSKKKWSFAGGSEVDENKNLVYALIENPGIFAIMSITGKLPETFSSDFRIGFDNINANKEILKKYNAAVVAFTIWFNNTRKNSDTDLYSKYKTTEALMLMQAAHNVYFKNEFTVSNELLEEKGINGLVAFNYIKTALAIDNKPLAVMLDSSQIVIIYKYSDNTFSVYNPEKNIVSGELIFDKNTETFDYDCETINSVAFFGDFENCYFAFNEIKTFFDYKHNIVQQDSIGPIGGSITVSSGNLSGFAIQFPQGALLDYNSFEIFSIDQLPRPPTEAIPIEPSFRITGIDKEYFEIPIEITIPYSDIDNDGYIDGTSFLEEDLFVAVYNYAAASWAQLKIIKRDTVNKNIVCETKRIGDFSLFGFTQHSVTPKTNNSGVFIYHTWPLGESVTDVLDKLVQNGIRKLYISAFECEGNKRFKVRFARVSGMPDYPGLNWSHSWFLYNNLMQEAKKRNIEVIFAITCWNTGVGVYVDDVDDKNSHSNYIVEKIVDFIVNYCPEVSGIMLDYVRYEMGRYTEQEKDTIVKFIKRVREKIGKKGLDAPRLSICVWASTGEDGRDNVGQRYSDFAGLADDLVIMLYGGNYPPISATNVKKYIQRGLIACTPDNNCSIIAAIQTYGLATADSVDSQLSSALKSKAHGYAIYRYTNTDDDEWNAINIYNIK